MRNATVLCIENRVDGLLHRKSLLEESGYNVLISTSPRHGLQLLQTLAVDAVIVDSCLPEIDGGELSSRIKQLKPHIPLIVLAPGEPVPHDSLPHADVVCFPSDPAHKLVDAVRESLGSRAFFLRWLEAWKSRAAV